MKLHRYYVHDMKLEHDFWMQDLELFHQWTRVLRYQVGRELVLFNEHKEQKLYKIVKIGDNAVHLQMVTEMEPKFPKKEVYLCFSLLKKDKNDWILQKGTELGVRHFVPLVCDRTEKTGFDTERAQKIVIEAAEQCERTDIPSIREPLAPQTAIEEFQGPTLEFFVAEQGSEPLSEQNSESKKFAIFIGPEGGWSDAEKRFFADQDVKHIGLSRFTLRAETAAITAAALVGNS